MAERLNRASDRPAYRQIADRLRAEVARGDFAPGAQLPSESALEARFKVSRVTARRALSVLVNDGLAQSEHGRGYFLRTPPPVQRLSSDRFDSRDAGTEDAPVEVLFVGRGPVPAKMAERLGLVAGDDVIVRNRRYLLEGRPARSAVSYIPLDIAAGTPIAEEDPGPGGIYARMEEQGLTFDKYDEEVTARVATEEESRLLLLPGSTPVLQVVRTAFADGRPVEVCEAVMDAAAFVLDYSLPARRS
ncbi:transcriptional regulator, GntR family [Cryptosporangium aurantiacum]|uniref:Transcriptional regulator, GntR family n=1 Tax=Cryptosporangium aurantiacum TaxID=134849 RepID=A0A1M7R8J0_9ACTN|nr:GntR family transcriptional regulator [Cryptosporangium aurantiacum]SHN42460.1 transcriptional regulator, GntR family [Cryptosporangium aurantiacum]